MIPSRLLCQALLNGPLARETLQAADERLVNALADATNAAGLPAFGAPWQCELAAPERREPPLAVRLRMLAPVILLDGVWLARVAQPATGHDAARGPLLRLYMERAGVDHPATAPYRRFRAFLMREGVYLPPLASPLFFQDPLFAESALRFAALHLGLLHRPVRFFPELLGYTLAHLFRKPGEWEEPHDPLAPARHRAWALEAIAASRAQGAPERRIATGWALYVAAFQSLERQCLAEAGTGATAAANMAAILCSKLPEAIGYHAKVSVQGKSLDDWLIEPPEAVLQMLRNSPYIDSVCPAGSRFIQAMAFGGPMFGVFDDHEREAALRWIGHPESAAPAAGIPLGIDIVDGLPPAPSASGSMARSAPGPSTRRQLYLALLRSESPADLPAEAEATVTRLLKRARWLERLGLGPFRLRYAPAVFTERIERLHRQELERYRPLPAPPKADRAFCRWAALQLAPAILVDGAWLAGIPTAAGKLDPTRRHLLKIYADELGDGRVEWNHPNVYRRLLASLGFRLPAFDSEAFANHPAFVEAAFDLPVYLLAMGLTSDRNFPELLGLNLAIELSGLGSAYLRASEILRYHGMDPAIIQLHLSIDNLASGHAARARDAVMLYLEEIRQREGSVAVQPAWTRIRQGYLSLRAASSSITMAIVGRYGLHRLGSKVPATFGMDEPGFHLKGVT